MPAMRFVGTYVPRLLAATDAVDISALEQWWHGFHSLGLDESANAKDGFTVRLRRVLFGSAVGARAARPARFRSREQARQSGQG
jgi:hypothetical protein